MPRLRGSDDASTRHRAAQRRVPNNSIEPHHTIPRRRDPYVYIAFIYTYIHTYPNWPTATPPGSYARTTGHISNRRAALLLDAHAYMIFGIESAHVYINGYISMCFFKLQLQLDDGAAPSLHGLRHFTTDFADFFALFSPLLLFDVCFTAVPLSRGGTLFHSHTPREEEEGEEEVNVSEAKGPGNLWLSAGTGNESRNCDYHG